jgi:ribose-phosphate pyrophosphokinase
MKAESVIFNLNEKDFLFKGILKELKLKNNRVEKGKVEIPVFSDGETCPHFRTSVRGKRVYILTSPNTPLKIMQLVLAIDAAKRASAVEIIPIIPYFPYARQDKRDQRRGPIGARVMAEMIEGRGATSLITFDLHSDQIEGFFKIPVIHLRGKYLFHDYIVKTSNANTVLCSPDAGGLKRVKKVRDLIHKRNPNIKLPFVSVDKSRPSANSVGEVEILGEVDGKDVLIIDDMCDTGNTLIKSADALLEAGALSVRVLVTHGVLSGDSHIHIAASNIKEFICSDSLTIKGFATGMDGKLTTISTARDLANAIFSINVDGSIGSIYR